MKTARSYRVCVLLFCSLLGAVNIALANPPATSSRSRMVSYCIAMFVGNHRVRQAKRYFSRMPRQRLKSRLTVIIHSEIRGTLAYASAAYVLAYYGIDTAKNMRRMLFLWNEPTIGDSYPSFKLTGEGHDDLIDT